MAKKKRHDIRILRQAELKRSPIKYQLPVYPETGDTLAIVLCIPNQNAFVVGLQTALAHFENQTHWQGAMGDDRNRFQSDWVGMVATMQCLDQTELIAATNRIGDALDLMNEEAGQTITLQELLDNPELWFDPAIIATIAPLLDILRFIVQGFPQIHIHPFKVVELISGMIRHFTMIGALMAIATAITGLVAAQGTQTLVGLAQTGIDYVFKLQNALSAARDDLLGVVHGFWTFATEEIDTNFDEIDYTEHWANQNSILTEMAAHLEKANTLTREGGGDCLCASVGGQTIGPINVQYICFTSPIEELTWEEFLDYRRRAMWWAMTMSNMVQSVAMSMRQQALTLAQDYFGIFTEEADDRTGLYLQAFAAGFAASQGNLISPFWLGNNTKTDVSDRESLLTTYFQEVLVDVIGAPDAAGVEVIINIFFLDAFQEVLSIMKGVQDSLWEDIYNFTSNSGAYNEFISGMGIALDTGGLPVMVGTKYNTLRAYVLTSFPEWVAASTFAYATELDSQPAPDTWIQDLDMGCGV